MFEFVFPETVLKLTVPAPIFVFVANTSLSNVTVFPAIPFAFISFNLFVASPTCPLTFEFPSNVNVPSFGFAITSAFIFELLARTIVPSPKIFKLSAFKDELNLTIFPSSPAFICASFSVFVPIKPLAIESPKNVNIPWELFDVVTIEFISLPSVNFNSELFIIPLFKTVFVAFMSPFTLAVTYLFVPFSPIFKVFIFPIFPKIFWVFPAISPTKVTTPLLEVNAVISPVKSFSNF